jgi:hypothetical protein
MRRLIRSFGSLLLVGGLAACAGMSGPRTQALGPRASAAEGYGATAAANEPQVGYSDSERHIADCLATHRSYDYRTDRFRTYSGQRRRCASAPAHAAQP